MDAEQLRMARAGIRVSVHELAEKAGVDADTISNISTGKHTETKKGTGGRGGGREASIGKIRSYLETFVTFIDPRPGEHGAGVILKEGVTARSFREGKIPEEPIEDGERRLLEYWRSHPDEWKALTEEARAATLAAIYGMNMEEDPILGEGVS